MKPFWIPYCASFRTSSTVCTSTCTLHTFVQELKNACLLFGKRAVLQLQKSIGVSKWITTAFKFLCGATTLASLPSLLPCSLLSLGATQVLSTSGCAFLFPQNIPSQIQRRPWAAQYHVPFQHVSLCCFIRCAPMAPSFRSASCMCPPVRSKIIRSSACL